MRMFSPDRVVRRYDYVSFEDVVYLETDFASKKR